MKHLGLVGSERGVESRKGPALACLTVDVCYKNNRAGCLTHDVCTYDYGSYCWVYDYCNYDYN